MITADVTQHPFRVLTVEQIESNIALDAHITTTGHVVVWEIGRQTTPVAEARIAWGPSVIDEDVVAQMDAIRAMGTQALPGQATLGATA